MMLPYTVNVTSVALHAHFLGRKMSVEQFRNGKKVRDLGRNDAYDYTNPEGTRHDPPVELLPGDELKTTCVYNSTKRQRDTYYGEGTFDEMCFGFIDYYPKFDKKRQRLCLSFERYDWQTFVFCILSSYLSCLFVNRHLLKKLPFWRRGHSLRSRFVYLSDNRNCPSCQNGMEI